MTDEKKPSGPDPVDMKRELSSLWHSALGQIDEIRDVIVRGSHAGKAKIDAQLLKRQKDKLLAQIAEALLDEVKRGAATLPASCEEPVQRLEDVERQLKEAEEEASKAFQKART